jgi:metacaspase-1
LKAIFSTLPAKVHLEVLLDCCHSGTATREVPASLSPQTASLPHTIKQRFLTPPIDILCRQLDEDDLPINRILKSTNPSNHVLFAGCRDNQTSADAYINGTYNGAFTYYLCRHIRDVQGVITRADLLKRLRASLRYEGYDQVPQLECPAAWKKKNVLE